MDRNELSGSDLRAAAAACTSFLGSQVEADWQARVPDLDFSVAEVVAHAAQCCLFYAIDLTAAGPDLGTLDIAVRSDAGPISLIATMATTSEMLATAVDAASPETVGFHPWGDPDRSGFAAMACDELLIHTDDAARGLGADFAPPTHLVEATLQRLFPSVSASPDPWEQLLWANGRIALDGKPRRERWKWQCSPASP